MLRRNPRQFEGGRAAPHLDAHTHAHTHTGAGTLRETEAPRHPPAQGGGVNGHPPCSAMGALVESGEGRSWDPEGLL